MFHIFGALWAIIYGMLLLQLTAYNLIIIIIFLIRMKANKGKICFQPVKIQCAIINVFSC